MNLKRICPLLALLLIPAFGVASLAQTPSLESKSPNPSPVKTNALALLAELEAPSDCDNPKCLADALSAKLKAAVAGLHSIISVDEVRDGMVADMQKRIDIRGGIITDLQKVDTNSQGIQTVDQFRIDACQQQLSKAEGRIFALEHPGVLKELFEPKQLLKIGGAFWLGRATANK